MYLRDIWPSMVRWRAAALSFDPETYRRLYGNFADQNPYWNAIPHHRRRLRVGHESPTFVNHITSKTSAMKLGPGRTLLMRGRWRFSEIPLPLITLVPPGNQGFITGGHVSSSKGVAIEDFNSYGARRGNHEIMVRGTFANVRIRNLMVPASKAASRFISRVASARVFTTQQ